MRPRFACRAAAPPGEWINDPNALIFADGRYHLFVQHSDERASTRRVGWARFSSPDLLCWEWHGQAIPPSALGSAYSGSVVRAGAHWEAWFTRHRDSPRRETQHLAVSEDGLSWRGHPQAFGPAGANMRDPFVVQLGNGGWRMLVAEPCDWTDWRGAAQSRLQVWRSDDRRAWRRCGAVGPWHDPGIMWEVPAITDLGAAQMLILSLIDRRDDVADCSVRYWLGRLDDSFELLVGFPPEGRPLDLGPDFYAAIPNTPGGWPSARQCILAWASTWRFAAKMDWGGGGRGGPISLPRAIRLAGDRVQQSPQVGVPCWTTTCSGSTPFRLTVSRGPAVATLIGDPDMGRAEAWRRGVDGLDWSAEHNSVFAPAKERRVIAFHDGDLFEFFFEPEGVTFTVALPVAGNANFTLSCTE